MLYVHVTILFPYRVKPDCVKAYDRVTAGKGVSFIDYYTPVAELLKDTCAHDYDPDGVHAIPSNGRIFPTRRVSLPVGVNGTMSRSAIARSADTTGTFCSLYLGVHNVRVYVVM